jgi:hypothetical protein
MANASVMFTYDAHAHNGTTNFKACKSFAAITGNSTATIIKVIVLRIRLLSIRNPDVAKGYAKQYSTMITIAALLIALEDTEYAYPNNPNNTIQTLAIT